MQLSPPGARSQARRAFLPRLETLESRLVPAGNPFDSTSFQTGLLKLLQEFDVPQASIAAERNGQIYTYGVTNQQFFVDNQLPLPADVTPATLFRIGSVSKSFASVALMTMVQAGDVNLADSILQTLGYTRGENISGFNPVDGKAVSAPLADSLFAISIADVMGMTSGLPLAVDVQSATFPTAKKNQVIYEAGSFAALAFAGAPPYTSGPADSFQQIRYYLYQVSREIQAGSLTLPTPGSSYVYNDTGYTMLGNLVARVAQNKYGLSYGEYLQSRVLTFMGLSPAGGSQSAMVGLAHTLANQAYPTEATYYTYPNELPSPSVFPDPNATIAPFYPTSDGNPVLVAQPYGGGFYIESHFANGGLTATPTALLLFFSNLGLTYAGQVSGPLSQANVTRMVQEQPIGLDLVKQNNMPYGWFGLGWQISSYDTTPAPSDLLWFKNGDLPGNSAELARNADGTVWAASFNIDVLGDGTDTTSPSSETPFATRLRELINRALYAPSFLSFQSNPNVVTPTGTTISSPFQVKVEDAFGTPLDGVAVTFTAPASGPGGSFLGTSITDGDGIATAFAFVANATPGGYDIAAQAGDLLVQVTWTNVSTSSITPLPAIVGNRFQPAMNSLDGIFVQGLYRNILNRSADSLGLGWWTGLIGSGVTRTHVAAALWESREHRDFQVTQYYVNYLQRTTIDAGIYYWLQAFADGASEENVVLGILNSDEYRRLYPTDGSFVNGLYADILGRAADPAGQQAALTFLANGGGREILTAGVIHSRESYERVIAGYYGMFLNRPADEPGLNAWVARLLSGEIDCAGAANAFLGSKEYYDFAFRSI